MERRKPASWRMLDAVDCGATLAQSAVRWRGGGSARRHRLRRDFGAERREPPSGLSSTLSIAGLCSVRHAPASGLGSNTLTRREPALTRRAPRPLSLVERLLLQSSLTRRSAVLSRSHSARALSLGACPLSLVERLLSVLLQSSLTWRALSRRPYSMQVPMLASRPGCSGVQGFFCSHCHGCRVGRRWLAGSARCRRLRSGAVHRAPCACERAQLDAVDCGATSARSAVRWRAGSIRRRRLRRGAVQSAPFTGERAQLDAKSG